MVALRPLKTNPVVRDCFDMATGAFDLAERSSPRNAVGQASLCLLAGDVFGLHLVGGCAVRDSFDC